MMAQVGVGSQVFTWIFLSGN